MRKSARPKTPRTSVKSAAKQSNRKKAASKKASQPSSKKSNKKPVETHSDAQQDNIISVVFTDLESGGNFKPGRPFRIERLLTPDEVHVEYMARKAELDADFADASLLLKSWWKQLKRSRDFKERHLTGASVRFRTKFGQVVSPLKVVVAVNVARKLPEDEVRRLGWTTIPKKKELKKSGSRAKPIEIDVKVLEGTFEFLTPTIGYFLRGQIMPTDPLDFASRITGGIPIAVPNQDEAFGTLGIVLSTDGSRFLGLTCNHVLEASSKLDQWGPVGANGMPSKRKLATKIAGSIEDVTIGSRTETVDGALVGLAAPPNSTGYVFPTSAGTYIRDIVPESHDNPPQNLPLYFSSSPADSDKLSGVDVWKFGASQGSVVKGRIERTSDQVFQIGNHIFVNNFTVRHSESNPTFVIPGDSGSVLALRTKVNGSPAFVAIGILFAKIGEKSELGIACNISYVLHMLKQAPTNWELPTSWLVKLTGSGWKPL